MQSVWLNIVVTLVIPTITLLTTEWIARGTLLETEQSYSFPDAISTNFASFFAAWLLYLLLYLFISQLSGRHALATVIAGLLGNVPAVVTYFKLTMRNEPFLPWDILQIDDLMGVREGVELKVQPNMIITLILYIVLVVLVGFVRLPRNPSGKRKPIQMITALASLGGMAALMFGIFLNPAGTAAIGIREDMWMQDRYYRANGVLTGFLTNLQMLNIEVPEGYSQETVENIAGKTGTNADDSPYYENSPAEDRATEEQPDIIFLMAESFWDMNQLEGVEYDRKLLENYTALSNEGASGKVYSPSFGGGTCDVEFEALTGFSMEHLPAGSKAFQQYTTHELSSLPNTLKERGYSTLAIHGYGRRFWNRDMAYPQLGIDRFVAEDDFVDPDRKRGYISDDAMVDKIIEEYQAGTESGEAMFIHAVTMQNHTTYDPSKYLPEDLVNVVNSPGTISKDTVGQIEDCATGIYEMDQALGKLTDYLKSIDRPTILVFWGDHLNPMNDGYTIFEETGMIGYGDTASPVLHETPLLIWSNYSTNKVDLGTIASYNISPVTMDLYGLEKPLFYEFLIQQMDVMRARTRGITVNEDGSYSDEMTDNQQTSFNEHAILQYDNMFGENYLSNEELALAKKDMTVASEVE